jgi:hypothetical protein
MIYGVSFKHIYLEGFISTMQLEEYKKYRKPRKTNVNFWILVYIRSIYYIKLCYEEDLVLNDESFAHSLTKSSIPLRNFSCKGFIFFI